MYIWQQQRQNDSCQIKNKCTQNSAHHWHTFKNKVILLGFIGVPTQAKVYDVQWQQQNPLIDMNFTLA